MLVGTSSGGEEALGPGLCVGSTHDHALTTSPWKTAANQTPCMLITRLCDTWYTLSAVL